ncbi:MAG: beta-lactamase family protein, partial [archaeon]|nr:beta-lactamase family protein [archaeon]
MVEVKGYCDERFNNVKMAFAKNFELGLEKGASFAVMIDGKLVVDIWGGYTDAAQTKYWEKDTIVNVWSTTKIMTALCVHILVDRGLIELDAPVIKYWPEFGQAGKEKILVRHILSHTSGVAGWDTKFTYKELVNWEK